ncbi:hypothetical protein GLOTRDRAFT_93873 [Gloeophyllum trabeum ATCC 11539]|uniref:Uncharacterized protein n=1 Tax=Gloeophyllum trabeum (strain ATCC 11539 / FP-39264 / Madison 617) TaxID=670483 RepID=S7RM04_GLOTA|nr:uncharacterized protein GLOTRDRAFT_93873 [Gloeophyllum trabeum ATCC 11539]EPQ55425.1 hypothetical protein GLOTRDRAFT_93873 [Gloeophyllum trabeum ATCC 11539]
MAKLNHRFGLESNPPNPPAKAMVSLKDESSASSGTLTRCGNGMPNASQSGSGLVDGSLCWTYGSTRRTYSQVLTHQLGPDLQRQLLKDVVQLAGNYLDFNLTIRQQASGQWEAFIEDASAQFPIFAKYPSSWPLRDYMCRYLCNRSNSRRRKSRALGETAKSGTGDKENEGMGASASQAVVKVGRRARRIETYHRAGSILTGKKSFAKAAIRKEVKTRIKKGKAQVYVDVPPRASVPASAARSPSAAPTLASPSPPPGSPAPQTDSDTSEEVKAFLRTLTPSMDHLHPKLLALGFRDLSAIAAWPKERLEALLEELVKREQVNWFDAWVVKCGLEAIKG